MIRRLFGRSGTPQSNPPSSTQARAPIFSTVIALSVGILVLLDLILDHPLLNRIGLLLIDYGLIIAVFALILGVLNLSSVHLQRIKHQQAGWSYSVILLLVLFILMAVGLVSGPSGSVMRWSLNAILLPLQSAFFSLLAFFLLGMAYRSLRINSVESSLFVGSALIVILASTPIGSLFGPVMVGIKRYLLDVPATAGARGLLLGIALGTIVTGLRLIFDGRRYFK